MASTLTAPGLKPPGPPPGMPPSGALPGQLPPLAARPVPGVPAGVTDEPEQAEGWVAGERLGFLPADTVAPRRRSAGGETPAAERELVGGDRPAEMQGQAVERRTERPGLGLAERPAIRAVQDDAHRAVRALVPMDQHHRLMEMLVALRRVRDEEPPGERLEPARHLNR